MVKRLAGYGSSQISSPPRPPFIVNRICVPLGANFKLGKLWDCHGMRKVPANTA